MSPKRKDPPQGSIAELLVQTPGKSPKNEKKAREEFDPEIANLGTKQKDDDADLERAKFPAAATDDAGPLEQIDLNCTERMMTLIANGGFDQEVRDAFAHCQDALPCEPCGRACEIRTPKQILDIVKAGSLASSGASLASLDLGRCAYPYLQYKRIKHVIDSQWHNTAASLQAMLRQPIIINADMSIMSADLGFKQLVRASADSEVAAVCLLVYWSRDKPHQHRVMSRATCDVVLQFQSLGTGDDFDLRKFSFIEEEEQQATVMGMSAVGKCVVLADIAHQGSDTKSMIKRIEDMKLRVLEGWNPETLQRYISIGRRLNASPSVLHLLRRWEYALGKEAAFEGITALRSLSSLAMEDTDAVYVCTVMCCEQLSGLRKKGSIVPLRGKNFRHEVPKVLKAVLARRDLLVHLQHTFPKMQHIISPYCGPSWYERFGVDHASLVRAVAATEAETQDSEAHDVDDENDAANENDETTSCSAFRCHNPLKTLLERLMRNRLEPMMCKLAGASVPGRALDLSAQGLEPLKKQLDDIAELYAGDFPPETLPATPHKVVHVTDTAMCSVLEVVSERSISDVAEYNVPPRSELSAVNNVNCCHVGILV